MFHLKPVLLCVLSDLVSSSLQAEVKLQYNSLSELLRHFWSCFPVKTQFLEEKVRTMRIYLTNRWRNLEKMSRFFSFPWSRHTRKWIAHRWLTKARVFNLGKQRLSRLTKRYHIICTWIGNRVGTNHHKISCPVFVRSATVMVSCPTMIASNNQRICSFSS